MVNYSAGVFSSARCKLVRILVPVVFGKKKLLKLLEFLLFVSRSFSMNRIFTQMSFFCLIHNDDSCC